ncbi:MAG: amino acid adenylation domain-containing protein, partial [Chloroflexi bacterium]
EVLLTGLGQALAEWTGSSRVEVELEGHGREELFEGVDLSRTVGWFTTMGPVGLELEADVVSSLRRVRGALHEVGRRLLDHGLRRTAGGQPAEVSFNYLGQWDTLDAGDPLPNGGAPDERRSHLVDVVAMVAGGRLRVDWNYSRALHRRETVARVAERMLDALRELVERSATARPALIPEDFPLLALTQEQVELLQDAAPDLEDAYPLTPLQEGMLFHTLAEHEPGAYVEQLVFDVRDLRLDAFQAAWRDLVARHPVLRTAVLWDGLPEAAQMVGRDVSLAIERRDLSGLPADARRAAFGRLLEEDRRRAFDVRRAPLMRVTVAELGEGRQRVLWSMHHLLLDGWSTAIVLDELGALYAARLAGRRPPAAASRPPFREYVAWLRAQDRGEAMDYWRARLAGFESPNELPYDARPGTVSPSAAPPAELALELSEEDTERLQQLCRSVRCTPSAVLQGAWAILLGRYGAQDEVVFGATTSGRPAELAGIADMVGMLIATLPVRASLGGRTVEELLRSLQEQVLESQRYGYASLTDIQARSAVTPGEPLFQTLVVFENYPVDEEAGDRPFGIVDADAVEHTNYPLVLAGAPGTRLVVRLQYDARLFRRETVARLMRQLHVLLGQMARTPEAPAWSLSPMSPEERRTLLHAWNETSRPYPRERCVHELFEDQVRRRPEAEALVYGEERLTYAELDRRANRLAHRLRELGVVPDVKVGLCLERSVEMVVGILGILKAGGAYLPLDPSYPLERKATMVAQAGARVVVTTGAWLDVLPAVERVVRLDGEELAGQPEWAPASGVVAENLACIFFTSGSLGEPKGIECTHRALVRTFVGADFMEFGEDVVYLQMAPMSWDGLPLELWPPLLYGGRSVLLPERVPTPALVGEVIRRERVDTVFLTTSLLNVIMDEAPEALAGLRHLMTGGEAVSLRHVALARERLPETRLVHAYGPVESTVYATTYDLPADLGGESTIPIGAPIGNTRVYVVDRRGQAVPVGVPGELWIGGDGLARGYMGQPGQTAERFVPDPFSGDGGRLYRTGDLVRWREDGNLEFLGRLDDQVKIRGHRIEPGEVESVLGQHPGVRKTVVLVRRDPLGRKRLVAYVVGEGLGAAGYRGYLRERLPEYLVPSAFVELAELPLRANGKVDRQRLPEPGWEAERGEYEAPRDEVEAALAGVWSEVLRVERVGVHDNFFELGGDSIASIRVVSRVRQALGAELPVRAVFTTPTIAGLADQVREAGASGAPALEPRPADAEAVLSYAQQRLWFLDQFAPGSSEYNVPLGLRLQGALDEPALRRALDGVVARHRVLRTSFGLERGEPRLVVRERAEVPWQAVDLRGLPAPEREAEARRLAEAEAAAAFGLDQAPLLRVLLLRLADDERVLVLNQHHIVTDGWS